MLLFYGIDLGTTNVVIYRLNLLMKQSILMPRRTSHFSPVEIYYENYQWAGDHFISSEEANQHSIYSFPSVVYKFIQDGRSTFLTGDPAKTQFKTDNYPEGRYYKNTKVEMDQNHTYVGDRLTPEKVSFHLLRTCFQSIMRDLERLNRDSQIPVSATAIGISYPAARNQQIYLENLKRAANEAAVDCGLRRQDDPLDFFLTTQEPYAAITSLMMEQCKLWNYDQERALFRLEGQEPFTVMVVDIGGGTSDIAVQCVQPSGSRGMLPTYPETIRKNGRTIRASVNMAGDFGGADFDEMLGIKLFRLAYEQVGRALPAYESWTERQRVIAQEQGEALKQAFSNDPDKAAVNVPLRNIFPDGTMALPLRPGAEGGAEEAAVTVERDTYRGWIAPYITSLVWPSGGDPDYARTLTGASALYSIQYCMNETKRNANCDSWDDIDYVFLTGGMSKMPEIKAMIREMIGTSTCQLIISDDLSRMEEEAGLPPARFIDIAMGVSIYSCLHTDTDGNGNIAFLSGASRKYEEFAPYPHSSIALFTDGPSGEMLTLIEHSQSLPLRDQVRENAFQVESIYDIRLQLYTGLSPYDPKLKKHALLNVPTVNLPTPRPHSSITLRYSIDQNMYAHLEIEYMDLNGVLSGNVPLQDINLNAARTEGDA